MSGALDGLRVVDFGQAFAGGLVAQMLADHGAAVVRVDPPGGPRWCTPANAILQRGKRSIVLDLHQPADLTTAQRLADRADVVVESFRPGVTRRLGLQASSRSIWCALPGFASDDPRAGVFACEGVVGAAAGLYASRDADPVAEPIYNTLPLCSSFAALIAANAIVAALIARHRDGHGQRIEVSLFDAAFEVTRYYADRTPAAPFPRIRLGGSRTMALTHHYVCRDGRFVHLSWLEEDRQLRGFARLVGLEDQWDREGLLDHARVRSDRVYSERLRTTLGEVFRTRTAAEWMALANPDADLAACLTTDEWLLDSEQARASRAVVPVRDPEYGPTHQVGFPVWLSLTPAEVASARHPLDADRATILAELADCTPAAPSMPVPLRPALDGMRAVDLTQILAGPTACRILAEFGAEIVQIANPHARAGRDFHFSTNTGKRTILLDLKRPDGLDVLWRLLDQADVLATNFSDVVAERLGVSEASVRRRRPDLITCRISAYGSQGPYAEYRGHDQVGQAVTGMEERWGRDYPTPLMQPHPVNDFGTGHLAAFGVLLALYHRARTGHGQRVAASLAHTATFLQTPFMLAYAGQTRDADPGGQQCRGVGPLERLYRASDGWFFLAAGPDAVDRLARVVGLDGSPSEASLAEQFARAPAAEWVARLTAAGLGAHVLNSIEDAMHDPWAVQHGLSREVDFPEAGRGRIVGPAARLSRTPMQPREPSPPLGWHAAEVLEQVGLRDRLPDLVASGAIVLPAGLTLERRP